MFVMCWVIDLPVLSCMQNQFLHLAKKYFTSTPKNNSLLILYISIIAFILQGWHIYIAGVGLFRILCSPSYYFNSLPARKWGLVQKDLESTLVSYSTDLKCKNNLKPVTYCYQLPTRSARSQHICFKCFWLNLPLLFCMATLC